MEFVPKANTRRYGLSEFCSAYLEAAEWAGIDDEDGEAYESAESVAWENNSRALAVAECELFQLQNRMALSAAYDAGYTETQAGHDFWLTRNRHGAGFWDRGLGEAGDTLTDAARGFGEVYVYIIRGEDGDAPLLLGFKVDY